MNTPGPFYTTEPDYALLGAMTAPDHVAFDDESFDIVFRQPVSEKDLAILLEIADLDVMGGYAADGNSPPISLGLFLDLPRKLCALLGAIGLLTSFAGLVFAGSSVDQPRPLPDDGAGVHEEIVAEFEESSPLEAATLVGVLHDYGIVSARSSRLRSSREPPP